MQADVILKDPLLWVPPVSLLGGARVGGGGGARPPPLVCACMYTDHFKSDRILFNRLLFNLFAL